MKRNMELIRELLQAIEGSEFSTVLPSSQSNLKTDWTSQEICYNLSLMVGAGFLDARPLKTGAGVQDLALLIGGMNHILESRYSRSLADRFIPSFSNAQDFLIQSMTWQGHDFLDSTRDESIWKIVKETLVKKGLSLEGVAFNVLTQLISAVAKNHINLE
jgi:hypothetical protein